MNSFLLGWFASAGHPVYDGEEYLAAVICDLQVDLIQDSITSVYPSENGFAMLLDRTGCIVFAPDQAYLTLFNELPNATLHQLKCLNESKVGLATVSSLICYLALMKSDS